MNEKGKVRKRHQKLGAKASDLGVFINDLAPDESAEIMGNIREAINTAANDGRRSTVNLSIVATPGDEPGEFAIKILFDQKTAKRQRTFETMTLKDDGQISFDEVLEGEFEEDEPEPPGLAAMKKKQADQNKMDDEESIFKKQPA